MLKNITLMVTIATIISSFVGFADYVSAEAPPRPANALRGSTEQEQTLLDALSRTPGYTPSVGKYVQEFKRIHSGNKTEAQHKALQADLVKRYPNEAKFFQEFLQRVANTASQQKQKVIMVLQAIQKDGKFTAKMKSFVAELTSAVKNAKNFQEAKAFQQRVINKYPNEAKIVMEYSNKFK